MQRAQIEREVPAHLLHDLLSRARAADDRVASRRLERELRRRRMRS